MLSANEILCYNSYSLDESARVFTGVYFSLNELALNGLSKLLSYKQKMRKQLHKILEIHDLIRNIEKKVINKKELKNHELYLKYIKQRTFHLLALFKNISQQTSLHLSDEQAVQILTNFIDYKDRNVLKYLKILSNAQSNANEIKISFNELKRIISNSNFSVAKKQKNHPNHPLKKNIK